mmetsp:Transcript_25428/g.55318  ORF Transcript_25428/g.55318 Transcript_25428/m.55318 type:complete len:249 (+) Transcript_25428:3-749(+)
MRVESLKATPELDKGCWDSEGSEGGETEAEDDEVARICALTAGSGAGTAAAAAAASSSSSSSSSAAASTARASSSAAATATATATTVTAGQQLHAASAREAAAAAAERRRELTCPNPIAAAPAGTSGHAGAVGTSAGTSASSVAAPVAATAGAAAASAGSDRHRRAGGEANYLADASAAIASLSALAAQAGHVMRGAPRDVSTSAARQAEALQRSRSQALAQDAGLSLEDARKLLSEHDEVVDGRSME